MCLWEVLYSRLAFAVLSFWGIKSAPNLQGLGRLSAGWVYRMVAGGDFTTRRPSNLDT